jgi:hypothetical protein
LVQASHSFGLGSTRLAAANAAAALAGVMPTL